MQQAANVWSQLKISNLSFLVIYLFFCLRTSFSIEINFTFIVVTISALQVITYISILPDMNSTNPARISNIGNLHFNFYNKRLSSPARIVKQPSCTSIRHTKRTSSIKLKFRHKMLPFLFHDHVDDYNPSYNVLPRHLTTKLY